jgi:hypothetical protein
MTKWSLLASAVVMAAVSISISMSLSAQQSATGSWTQPKTPWGDPDLQGVWRYEASCRSSGRGSFRDVRR